MNLRRIRSGLPAAFAATLALCGLVHAQARGTPTLINFTPPQGAAGSTVTITFTGTNFAPQALGLLFNPAQGLTVASLQVVSPAQIVARVQIDPGAQPGSRRVLLTVADHTLISPSPFTVTAAAAPPPPTCPPGTAACGSPPAPPTRAGPALRGFTPLQGTQGTSVSVIFTGANFTSPASVQFTPNSGLTVQSTSVANANQIQAQVNIAPNAALGARNVVLIVGSTRLPASNTFTVVSGASLTHVLPMQILRVVPNQIAAGAQNVDLALEGRNFVPGTQVVFTVGAGVPAAVFANGPARYVNSTEIHVTVNALPNALPGGRDINLQVTNQAVVIGKGMLNVTASKPSGPPSVLKIAPISLQTFTKGVIQLDAPQWGDQWDGEIEEHDGIPLLDDDVVFKWHEQNPGVADYYELRIYAKDGKTLLITKKIGGSTAVVFGSQMNLVPTYFRPDAAFLAALLSQTGKVLAHGFVYTSPSSSKPVVAVKLGYNPPPPNTGPQLSDGDMQWEVAGFHTYNNNGVAPQKPGQSNMVKDAKLLQGGAPASSSTTDIEVEVSTRWPLGKPLAPTGLVCSGTGMGSLQVTNVADKKIYDSKGKPTGGIDPNDYVQDPWVLSGNFDLSRSPYAAHPNLHQLPGSQCAGCLFGTIDQVQFDDLFVDWGDGNVQRVSAQPKDPNTTNWNRGEQLSLPQNATSPYVMRHAYQNAGSFTIRVFQLSEADAQHANISLVAASADGPTTPFLQAAVLSNVASQGKLKQSTLTQGTLQAGFQTILAHGNSGAPQGSSVSQVANDAFMIYCHPVNITVPEDLDADGPLHLKSIDDPNFPGYDTGGIKINGTVPKNISLSGKPESPSHSAPHELLSGASQQKGETIHESVHRPGGEAAAICSTCDDAMLAQSHLHYYGRGWARITWTVDSTQSAQTLSIPPSQARTNLKRSAPGQSQPPIIISVSDPLNSQTLALQPLGMHAVSVEADVAPQPTNPHLSIAVGRALGSVFSPRGGSSGGAQSTENLESAQSLLNTLAPPAGSNLPPLKVGVLSPSNHNSGGMGAVQYVNGSLQQLVAGIAKALPDQHVASQPKQYQVVASDPKQPCKFLFPVKSGGTFEISGLQNHLSKQGTKFSGTGNLIVHLANSSSGGYDAYPPVQIKINNWDVPDGQNVRSGAIDVSPQITLAAGVPGLKGTIDRLQGQAGAELDATLSVTLSDDTLRLPGVEKPQSWSGITSELKPSGDWIKDNLSLSPTLVGWSAFKIQSNKVRIDLSHHDGDAAGSLCGFLSGSDWVGVRFSSLTVTPYTMDLVSSSALQPTVTDWGVVGSGLCGSMSTGPFTAKLGDGSISFGSINATASNGNFSAQYKGMDVYVPWLDTHLKGDASLQSGGGKQASISFPFTGSAVSKTYGNISFKASNLSFTQQQNIGWVVQANTHFSFVAENTPFASFDQPFFFGMDGRGYFAKGDQAEDVSLGGSSHLGQTPIDLVSAHVTAPPSGNEILGIQFNTNVHISEVMAAAPAQVNYEIDKSGSNYSSAGPTNSPFSIDVPYPAGQPSSEAKVRPVYSGANDTEYSGTVDLSELGGPPATGEFRLGYKGGHDYWLTRVSFSLGDTGIVLIPAPPVMNLYKIQGGIGHNFPISAFKDVGSLSSENPVFDNSFLFMAGMRVGMPDQFTYTLDGDLVIKSGGQDGGARMDFHSWLIKHPDNGNGDFQGYFQYAGSNFDGRLWGRLSFMNDAAYVDLGSGENDAAVDIHFGPAGPWHIDAGKQQGPRIRGHLLVADADMYVMLSDAGLSLGGGESINLTVGDDSVASAYVRANVDMGLTITPQPHISGDFSANAEAGVCVDGVCVSDNAVAQVHAEFSPLHVQATSSLPLPWPLSDITITVHL